MKKAQLSEQKPQPKGDVVAHAQIVQEDKEPNNGGYIYHLRVQAEITWPSTQSSPEMIIAEVSSSEVMEMHPSSGNTYTTESFEHEGQPGDTLNARVYAKWLEPDDDADNCSKILS